MMSVEEHAPTTGQPRRLRVAPVIRLVAGLGLTFGILPYAWGRLAIFWMLIGSPELLYVSLFVLSVAAVMLVTRNLSTALGQPSLDGWLAWGIAVGWVVANVVLLAVSTGPPVPWYLVAGAFVPATLWVVWLAWILYWPLLWRARLFVLVALFVLGGVGLSIKAEGMSGDARVSFMWRWDRRQEQRLEAADGSADLSRTTANDYGQYLGPQRLGVLPEARLARDWQQHPPRLLWRRPVGLGWSSFAVVGDYALTQEQRGDQECTVCYRVSDGSIVWIHGDPVRFAKSLGGPGPRATPTVAGGRVYTVGATGLLNCLEGASGQCIWAVNILTDNRGHNIAHGVCSSPLVVDDLVVVCPTGSVDASLAAYDLASSRRVWQAGGQEASYGSPLVADIAGVRQILIHAGEGVAGHDLASGKQLWFFPWTNGYRINCAQPIPNAGHPGQVFAGTGYDTGSTLFRLERASDESWSCQRTWESKGLRLKYTTAVLHEAFVYGLDDGVLQCLDAKSGKKMWKDGRYGHGQLLLAGDLLLIQAENGNVVLVEPSPEGLRELGQVAALEGKSWSHPALAGKRLLVRNDREAACYELPLDAR